MSNRLRNSRFMRPEQLEGRSMLSGHPVAAAFAAAAHDAAAQFASAQHAVAPAISALQASVHQALSAFNSETLTRLTTTLTDANSSATGTAYFHVATKNGVTETELYVKVAGAAANTPLDVSVDGTVVGTLTTDANGAGKLVISTNPKGSEVAPTNPFPTTVAAGSVVTVATSASVVNPTTVNSLTGTLATPPTPVHSHFSASLTDPNSSATGTAKFSINTEHGTTETELSVKVTGAAASSPLDVTIDGVVVGTLMTDASGNGSIVISTNPKGNEVAPTNPFPSTAGANSVILVGESLTGTLAASTDDHGGCGRD